MPNGSQRTTNVLLGMTVICVVTMTALSLAQFLRSPRAGSQNKGPEFVESANAAALADFGHRVGSNSATVVITVFSDFQCPACAAFANRTLPALREKYPDKFVLNFRHWPLEQHPHAFAAATAAECAASQNRFEAFHDLLFAQQSRIGQEPFRVMASDAGVQDLDAFERCLVDELAASVVRRDSDAIQPFEPSGTPTIVVGSTLIRGGASLALLDSLLANSLKLLPGRD